MELNSVLFPAPPPSYNSITFSSEMVWIPNVSDLAPIPCLYLRCTRGSSKVLMYFHGNAEDVGLAYTLMDHIRTTLLVPSTQVHVIAVEFPSYGIYPGDVSAERLTQDASTVFSYLTTEARILPRNIIAFGRSIGTGPATFLASEKRLGALILMSAYTSIRSVVRHIVGPVMQHFVAERFRNIDLMPKVTCPTFIVHGQRDTLIPFHHSQALHELCNGPCCLTLPKDMDHNLFDFFADLSDPFKTFMRQCGLTAEVKAGEAPFPDFSEANFLPPVHPAEIMPTGRWKRLHSLLS